MRLSIKFQSCILDRTNKINEREIFIQENSSFEEDFSKLSQDPNSFHITKGLFGDFVERNNIMNVFGHLLKSERNQTFVDRSKEFTSSMQTSLDQAGHKSRVRNFSNGDILPNLATSKENSLESISSLLNKKQMDSQISGSSLYPVLINSWLSFQKRRLSYSKRKLLWSFNHQIRPFEEIQTERVKGHPLQPEQIPSETQE